LLAERVLDPETRSAQSLAPALNDLLESVGWRPREVQVVAVVVGPGSFTGLRVGVTTAKTFAYAVEADVVAVNTLETIAWQVSFDAAQPQVHVAMDAQRGELYCGVFERLAAEVRQQEALRIETSQAWLAALPAGCRASGPAMTTLAERLPAEVGLVEPAFWHPTAAAVALLAARRHAAGQRDDLWRLVPLYMRKSAAEEKREG